MAKTKKSTLEQKSENLGELNFTLKHYEHLTVKDVKELLENEADENILYVNLEGSLSKLNIENVLIPVEKDSAGDVIRNESGEGIRFVCKANKDYDPVSLKCNTDTAKLRHSLSLAPYFEDQLKLIKDESLRNFVKSYIEHQPKFKIEYPTSSTGMKFIPQLFSMI